MLRFKVLVSVVPLMAAAVMARLELLPGPQPCIAVGSDAMQIATSPWHADLHVSFTDDPALATVRVALADSADTADFAIVDDIGSDDMSLNVLGLDVLGFDVMGFDKMGFDDMDEAEGSACATTQATRFVLIAESPPDGAPVIYLSPSGPADYRIFVRSRRTTEREAAALIVGAKRLPPRLADGSL